MEPEFDNIDKYLQSGERTKVTDKIKDVSKQIDGQTDIMLIGNILMWMNQNTVRLKILQEYIMEVILENLKGRRTKS